MTTGSLSAAHLTGLTTALAGRYRLERELGAGGMATVWLAEDLRHGRPVAIKVLHPELSAVLGPERFLAEIRTTANLQHPHILPLFDSGAAEGLLYYVMPFVDGETLRARLERERQLPLGDALRLTSEVAEALDYAHHRGVVHRDIKPENILLQGGHALVADFGIALAVQHAGGPRMTQTGLSLGTPQYMAPEQAMGERTIDARADIYALGAVTYEVLTGEPPFTGPTVQAIVARVMAERPRSPRTVRDTVPPAVERAVMTALSKLPADRQASVGQFAAELRAGADAGLPAAVPARAEAHVLRAAPGNRTARWLAGAAVAATLVATSVATWSWRAMRAARDERPVVRFDVTLGAGMQAGGVAVSPNGRTLAFTAESAGVMRLYVRPLNAAAPRVVHGTGALLPHVTFSPDGQWLAFVADGQLRKIPIAGGRPTPLADVGVAIGVAWPRADVLVVAANMGRERGLRLVPAGGGPPRPLTRPPAEDGSVRHFYPRALPDGRHVAFTIARGIGEAGDSVGIASLETGTVSPLGVAGRPLGVVGDRLVFRAPGDGALMALPIDVRDGRATGEAVPLGETVGTGAASPAGVLVTSRERLPARVEWVRPDGIVAGAVLAAAAEVADPRLSPDGRRLALAMRGADGWEIWIQDIASGTLSRLATRGHRPEWTPDGTRVLFRDPTSVLGLAWQPVDFAGTAAPLAERAADISGALGDAVVSPDGQTLLFVKNGDFYAVPLRGDSTPTLFLQSSANNQAPRFSPDGSWVAFHSAISGRREVYVTPWPGPGPRHQVSVDGGAEPVWARDGRRLFYRDGPRLVAATLDFSGAFAVRSRAVLFEGDFASDPAHAQYDVAPDGRFVVLRGTGESARLAVVLNWKAEVGAASAR